MKWNHAGEECDQDKVDGFVDGCLSMYKLVSQ